jgi:hypothetical protein
VIFLFCSQNTNFDDIPASIVHVTNLTPGSDNPTTRVAASAYALGLAKRGAAPTYEQLVHKAKKMMYNPAYRCYM